MFLLRLPAPFCEGVESIDYPAVRKRFRVTIDVEAALDSGPQGGMLLTSPEGVLHTKAFVE
jgi:hypothetical protein